MSHIFIPILKRFIWILLLALFVALFFGRIISLNFGGDDYAGFAVLRSGIFPCEYPYWADYIRMRPLFQLFGLSQPPYYVVTLLFFFLSALIVGFFAQTLLGRASVALVSSFVYVGSFVGAASMHTILESIRHTQYVSMLLLTLSFYILSLRGRRRHWYWVALGSFAVTTFLFPYRAYPLVFLLFLLEIIIGGNRHIIRLIQRLVPFVLIDGVIYVGAASVCSHFPILQSSGSTPLTVIARLVEDAFGMIRSFFTDKILNETANVFSLFVPNSIIPLQPTLLQFFTLAVSIITLVFWKNQKMKKSLLFLLFATVTVIFAYAVVNTDYVSTAHRYFFTVRPFVAIILASILVSSFFSFIRRRKNLPSFFLFSIVLIVIAVHTYELISYQNRELYYRGEFSKRAMATIQKHVTAMTRYTVVFIDGETDVSLDRFWGMFQHIGTPGWAFVPYYGNDPTYYDVVTPNHCALFWQIHEKRGGTFDLYYFIADATGVRPASTQNVYIRCKRT